MPGDEVQCEQFAREVIAILIESLLLSIHWRHIKAFTRAEREGFNDVHVLYHTPRINRVQ